MQILEPEKNLGTVCPNIATMLKRNVERFGERYVFLSKRDGTYEGITWKKFYEDILNIAFNLQQFGFQQGDKIVIFSPNRLEMLELELAVMASGGIGVPIFAYYNSQTAERLILHSDSHYLAVAGTLQLERVNPDLPLRNIFVFDQINLTGFKNLIGFTELLKERHDNNFCLSTGSASDDVCLNMYTSGTMGAPKCVQLSHRNILSQQAALDAIDWWSLDENDRFLSYLPWHHSFGGIFELFNALYRGASYSLEPGYGKDPRVILENWKLVRPTVFFSVPQVYRALFELTKESREAEQLFFHPELKFVFTAAAPLPQHLSDEFEKRNIPVIEGWGLTETSPCCTLTDPKLKREPGVVGKPIPGVSIRIADDGEIYAKGPNVMSGYYMNDQANRAAFTSDGWFCTGDVGELTDTGLKLIARKDRMFKLSDGEMVIPTEIETLIQARCHYIAFALVVGNGRAYPAALLFPNKKLLDKPEYGASLFEGCCYPRSLSELGNCLPNCLNAVNCCIMQKFARIKTAMLIDGELSLESGTLTPSMKVAPNNVVSVYKGHLENLYGGENAIKEEVYVIQLSERATT